jgi:hypothetical protein
MPRPKRIVVDPFARRARSRSMAGPETVTEADVGECEMVETAVTWTPSVPGMEVALTLQFKCSVKIVRGDTVTFRLGGFKGPAGGMMTLEARPHPDGKDFRETFHALWTGSDAVKGSGPPADSITLLCRTQVEANTLVIVGIPDAARIALPEKLAADSAKLKIEAVLKHKAGGEKFAKVPVAACPEVKKRAQDDDIAELSAALQMFEKTGDLSADRQSALEVTRQEVDQIWAEARNVSHLPFGVTFDLSDSNVFRSCAGVAQVAQSITENFTEFRKKRLTLPVHREIAANLGVKLGSVVIFEDALYCLCGSRYPELTRSALLVLRLYTCEAPDLARIFASCGAHSPVCMHREIDSGLRTGDAQMLTKWAGCIALLTTCCRNLSALPPQAVPVLYRGVRDLPSDAIQHALTLTKGAFYSFTGFTSWTAAESPIQVNSDESLPLPPDNSILYELHGAVDGIETTDVHQYAGDDRWMLPMFSSFSVVRAEAVPDKNGLIHVVLQARGSLAGAVRDDQFPKDLRGAVTQLSTAAKNANTDATAAAVKSLWMAKMIYCNRKLEAMRAQLPAKPAPGANPAQAMHQVVQAQYCERFAEVHRASLAKASVEDGPVHWEQQHVAAAEPDPRAGASRGPGSSTRGGAAAATQAAAAAAAPSGPTAFWEALPKKHAITLEAFFLKRTLAATQFTGDGVTVDFATWSADFGKGMRNVRRVVGKAQTHPFVEY